MRCCRGSDATHQPKQGRSCCSCFSCIGYNSTTLSILNALIVIIAIVASIGIVIFTYNREPSSDWILVGALSSSSAAFRIRVGPTASLVIATDAQLANIVFNYQLQNNDPYVESITAGGLATDTQYYYATYDVKSSLLRKGQFRTIATDGQRMNFTIATAGSAWTGSQAQTFNYIVNENPKPLLFLYAGDLHYENVHSTDISKRFNALDVTFGSKEQSSMFNNMGLAYMWDDHDWLGNDSRGYGVGREAALRSYTLGFPYYTPLPAEASVKTNSSTVVEVSPYQAFTIGSVRFILTDLKSQSNKTSIYSKDQRDWFFGEISNSSSYDFVVWLSTKPWIGTAEPGDDGWVGYADDRRELSDHISSVVGQGKQNFLAVASDADMVAFDSGVNTYYGTNTSVSVGSAITSFPILQSGPLDRMGGLKGGPFTDGCFTTTYDRVQQYSTLSFEFPDSSGSGKPCMIIKSYRIAPWTVRKDELLSKRLCGDIFAKVAAASQPAVGSCKSLPFHMESIALLGVAALFIFFAIGSSFCLLGCRDGVLFSLVTLLFSALTLVAGGGVPFAMGYYQFDTFPFFLLLLLQIIFGCIFLRCWAKWKRSNVNLTVNTGRARDGDKFNKDISLAEKGDDIDNDHFPDNKDIWHAEKNDDIDSDNISDMRASVL